MRTHHGLSPELRREFDLRGVAKLARAVPLSDVKTMADLLWASLAKNHGLRRGEPDTWTLERPFGHQAIQASGAFAAMASPAVVGALDDLMGQGAWQPPERWGQPLVCFPTREQPWTLPHQIWHLDGPAEPGGHIRIGRIFVILEPLIERGGGTIFAEGSHHFVRRLAERNGAPLSSGDTRAGLKSLHPWFRDLMKAGDPSARLEKYKGAPTLVDGVKLQVTEMTGDPGDVWIMHPDLLHAPAPNVRNTPRMVLTQFVSPKP